MRVRHRGGRDGHAYVTGRTYSGASFPTQDALQALGQGSFDAFVSMLTPGGDGLQYSTHLGGEDSDEGYGIAVDAAANVYVTGRTFSAASFPVTPNAFQSHGLGSWDAFVSKLALWFLPLAIARATAR